MQWFGGSQIKVKGASDPESDHGPAMATDGSTIYLAYVGTGGKNLYTSFGEIDPANSQTWQTPVWQGNTRVKLVNGEEPTANDRPAIAIYPVGPMIAYTDHETGQLVTLSPQGEYWNNNGLSVFPDGIVFRQPLMTVCNFTEDEGDGLNIVAIIHLCAVDKSGDLWFSSQRMSLDPADGSVIYSDWQVAQNLNQMLADSGVPPGFNGVQSWNLTSAGDSAFLYGFNESISWIFRRTPRDWNWQFLYYQLPPNGQPINPWAGISEAIFGAPVAPNIQVHFTFQGTDDLFSGVSSDGEVTLTQVAAINPGGVQAKTDGPPATATLPVNTNADVQAMLIAYKSNDSGRLYFALAM